MDFYAHARYTCNENVRGLIKSSLHVKEWKRSSKSHPQNRDFVRENLTDLLEVFVYIVSRNCEHVEQQCSIGKKIEAARAPCFMATRAS